jgi:hypothetical protein
MTLTQYIENSLKDKIAIDYDDMKGIFAQKQSVRIKNNKHYYYFYEILIIYLPDIYNDELIVFIDNLHYQTVLYKDVTNTILQSYLRYLGYIKGNNNDFIRNEVVS